MAGQGGHWQSVFPGDRLVLRGRVRFTLPGELGVWLAGDGPDVSRRRTSQSRRSRLRVPVRNSDSEAAVTVEVPAARPVRLPLVSAGSRY